jgi:homocysteine S-methyltransferase
MIVTGDVRSVGDYPDATAVFDVDSIGLTNVVTRLNHGLDIGGQAIGSPTGFHIGVQVNPGAEDLESEVRRFDYKVEAGAEYAITKPVFDLATFERLYKRIEGARVPLIVGLWPFESVLNAEFMANEVPGVSVPEPILKRMRGAGDGKAAAEEGVAIARELGSALKGTIQGVHVAAPNGRVEAALDVLAGLRQG